MAKRVFFSFHYQDVIDFRANVVRNHWLTKPDRQSAGFFDSSIWEDAKKTSDLALKRLINSGLKNTSNTCILVGSETFNRRWVSYEIMKSLEVGNHIFCVHINSIKGKDQKTKPLGENPLYYLGVSFSDDGKKVNLHDFINNKWIKYPDLEGWNVKEVDKELIGKIHRLSEAFEIYDWIDNNGYNNFSNWVK
ncbi:TIR domain-containing protein [Flavobacterium lacisediminis]|uniref:TIR domain-containing protein n=1 Tax=Flavobacterium lacisediminis TaxID=2989705 RepID=A0ABT3EL73_9FLAO|nr:TIR domain-containing protein [Flavobacterium lacisediminis]MCW1149146.1 TIR domain-containing protein [Flavobacterium lacisediminis]